MTRKHFTAIAESLRQLRMDLESASASECDNMISLALEAHVKRLGDICKAANPAFSRERFRQATEI